MATITSAVGAAGNFSTGAAWVGGVAPTAADDAVLQATTTSMTIDAGSVCRSLTTTLFTGTLTHTAGVTLTIGDGTAGAGNVALAFGTFTYTLGNAATSAISFISTSATQQTVNFNGKTTGNVTFNATSNGSWKLTGGHTIGTTGTMTLTKGTLDVNGQTVSWGSFNSDNSNTRALTLGAAVITITGTGSPWTINTATGMTFTANTSSITLNNNTGTGGNFLGGGLTYYDVALNNGGAANTNAIAGTNTFHNFSRTGTALKTDQLQINADQIVTNALTFAGNSSINRLGIVSQNITVPKTFTTTGATVTVSNTDFRDIVLSVAKDLSAQTDVGDCGGNSGITFPASVTQTWSGTSGGNWSANAWTTRVPLPQDDVVINVAFSASQTVTADMPRLGRNIDWTGSTGSPTFAMNSTTNDVYGSFTLINDMTFTHNQTTNFYGRNGTFTLTSAGKSFSGITQFIGSSSTWNLTDAYSNGNAIDIGSVTFNTNNFSVTVLKVASNYASTRTINFGLSTITLTRTSGLLWDFTTTTGLTFNGSNSTIIIQGGASGTYTFNGGGQTFGTLTYTAAGSTNELDIVGSNSFATINFSDASNARSLKFTAGTTTTIRNASGFNVRGTSTKLMTVASITAATHTLSSTGLQSCDYLSVTNSIATGGVAWYAGANSTNVSGNTGWTFTAFTGISGTSYSDLEYGAYASMTGVSGVPLSMQKLSFYNSQTGSNYYSVMEAEIAFLKNKTTLYTEQSLETLWRSYIISKGIPNQGTLKDMKMNLFRAGGFS